MAFRLWNEWHEVNTPIRIRIDKKLRSLRKINDNYEGIIVRNVLEWLLDK